MKIVFMGTPEFSVPALKLLNTKFGVEAVVTVPDKPQGRGLKLIPSPVKKAAAELNIKVFQPEKLKDEIFISQINDIQPDIIVVIAFRILPKELYSLARIASFNIHGSLLPKYRGAAPINWAIIKGETKSGLTSFILQDKVDTGNILLKHEIDLYDGITAGELHDLMMPEAANLAVKTTELLFSGNYTTIQQDNIEATPAPKIFRDDCKINWSNSSLNIRNFIHGLSPYPGSFTTFNKNHLKIVRCRISDKKVCKSGEFLIENGKLYCGTDDISIELLEIQPENKKLMKTSDFLLGYRGDKSGELK